MLKEAPEAAQARNEIAKSAMPRPRMRFDRDPKPRSHSRAPRNERTAATIHARPLVGTVRSPTWNVSVPRESTNVAEPSEPMANMSTAMNARAKYTMAIARDRRISACVRVGTGVIVAVTSPILG